MDTKKRATLVGAAMAGALAVAAIAAPGQAQELEGFEQCYGIALAGQNDCANAAGTHSCAGQSSVDGHGGDWIYVPTGTCERLVNGTLEPSEV